MKDEEIKRRFFVANAIAILYVILFFAIAMLLLRPIPYSIPADLVGG